MATEITGLIGLLRAEDSTGCVVAIDGHRFDVAHILAKPDVGLVQLHGVSPTGGPGMAPPGHGRRARAVPGLPVHRSPVMSGHRVTIETAGTPHRRGRAPGSVPLWLAVPLTIPRRAQL